MSDPYGRPAGGQQEPGGGVPQQPGWGAPPPSWDSPQPAWGTQQPAWGTQQPSWDAQPPPAWPAAQQPGWAPAGPPPRRSRAALWWSLGAAVVAVLVAVGVTVVLLTRPVDPPRGVAAAVADDGVVVSWRAADGVASYEVHRGDERLGTTTGTRYVDAEAPGGTEHRYTVTALDDDGERSDPVETAPVLTPLDPLTEFGAASQGVDVLLDWEPVTGADRYEITRDGELLDDAVTESPYRDEDVPLGEHEYALTAVDEDGAGSTTSIDLTFFARGPWQEAYEIAETFPDLVPAEPGLRGWRESTCAPGDPDEEVAVVVCDYPDGLRLQVLQFPDTAARNAELDAARAFGGPQITWSYGNGPAEGELVLSPPGPTTWRYVTFYAAGRQLFVLRVDWDGHSQEEIDAAWFIEAPF